MGNIYDLKTVQKTLTGGVGGTDLEIGAVPAGKVRYIVWLKIHAPSASMVTFFSASGPATGVIPPPGIDKVMDKQGMSIGDTIAYPDVIDPNTRIFDIEGTTIPVFLGVITDGAVDTELTLIYFDE